MVKLTKIEFKGFRGSRFSFSVDFGKGSKSIAIFGDNASGKSSITDAIEWFFYDRVDHLWKEDCGEAALRHIALDHKELTEVRLEFNNAKLNGTKTLDGDLNTGSSYAHHDFLEHIEQSLSEKLILRSGYLHDFVLKKKSEKRDEIARIIGYGAVTRFRETIQRVLTRTKSDEGYTGATEGLERSRTKLLRNFKTVPRTTAEYLQLANELCKGLDRHKKITDARTYDECLEDLKTRITDPKKGEKLAALKAFKATAEELGTVLEDLNKLIKAFLASYDVILNNLDKLRSIDLIAFLSKGRELIEKGRVSRDRCPFCLWPISDIDHLVQEVISPCLCHSCHQNQHKWSRLAAPHLADRGVARGGGAQEIQLPSGEGVRGLGLGVAHIGTMLKTPLKTGSSSLVQKTHVAEETRFWHCVPAYGRLLSGRVKIPRWNSARHCRFSRRFDISS